MKRMVWASFCTLLMSAGVAQAVPVSFQFSSTVYGGGGVGDVPAPYPGLRTLVALSRLESDIQSAHILTGLTDPAEWRVFFSTYDATAATNFQLNGMITDLRPAVAVPEPGTAGLLLTSLGISLLGFAKRRRVTTG